MIHMKRTMFIELECSTKNRESKECFFNLVLCIFLRYNRKVMFPPIYSKHFAGFLSWTPSPPRTALICN
jgi:hypothetical protein